MNQEIPNKYKIILASRSPRRQHLLKEIGLDFKVKIKDVEESYPKNFRKEEIVLYLCKLKASVFNTDNFENNELLITADTIVCLDEEVLNKPDNRDEAVKMLEKLSGQKHEVITGVCLKSKDKCKSFYVSTDVYFKKLSPEEIEFYVDNFKPYDKAGSYGIQEWIGYVGIEKINGSYFNVVGLPTSRLYEELKNF